MMLSPDNRRLLIGALRPPTGYEFDRGICTTYSLDLLTLLIAPLSLSIFDMESAEEALRDPLLVLEGLRRYAGRLSVFCQAGQIKVPPRDYNLFRWLEGMIVEVTAPKGGVFHPKVWLLRYVSEGKQPFYRFLNLSRNLTFDKSWDLMLQLDGLADTRKATSKTNQSFCDFMNALPGLATSQVSQRIIDDITLLEIELRTVKFLPPKGAEEEVKFFPFGTPKASHYSFNQWIGRYLVISPFLTDDFLLKILSGVSDGNILISREEEIDHLEPATLQRFQKIYVFDDIASQGLESNPGDDFAQQTQETPLNPNLELSGLHAKLIVGDIGWDAVWLVGSANATSAGFGNNVEFMVELRGKKSQIGIDKVLGKAEEKGALINLLLEYEVKERSVDDPVQQLLEQLLEDVRRWLIRSPMELNVTAVGQGLYDLTLSIEPNGRPRRGTYQIDFWPISLREDSYYKMSRSLKDNRYTFRNLSLLALTPFLAFRITAQSGKAKLAAQFVLKIPICGLPPERDDAIFSSVITDKTQLLRYLRILLIDEGSLLDLNSLSNPREAAPTDPTHWKDLDLPLLEQIVRALSRNPESKIDHVAEIVERLKRTPEGREMIAGDFEILWNAVMLARSRVK
jgi:hypothetical protein